MSEPAGAAPVAELLERMPLFAGLSDVMRERLAERLHRQALRRGEVLFHEGELGEAVHLVLSGKIKISRAAPDGRENLLALLGPGELLGELALFDPGPRTATATALVDTEIATLAHDELRPWLRSVPEAAELLLRALARRLRRTNDARADLVFTDVPGRVAKALLALADRFGSALPDGVRVDHGLTQEELAQLVGASRETVNKALADFAGRGWIRLDSKAVDLVDLERLRHRAH